MYANFKKTVNHLIGEILHLVSTSYISFISRRNKNRIYIFTDSRGSAIEKMSSRRNALTNSYILSCAKNYHVTPRIAIDKYTSIIDFIHCVETNKIDLNSYQKVILHLGVVDFSPRPLSSLFEMEDRKRIKLNFLGLDVQHKYYDTMYCNEKTASFLSIDDVIQLLDKYPYLKNCIWVLSNRVLLNWDGNYWKARPSNINKILDYNKCLIENGCKVVELKWTDQEIIKYTCDNIHPNRIGFTIIDKYISELV